MKKEVCCICGCEINGWGNNPAGAMCKDSEGNAVELTFGPNEVCCDECNKRYVIPSRIYKMNRGR